MKSPKIDPALLFTLDDAPGLYGSLSNAVAGVVDDRTLVILVFNGGALPADDC